MCRLCVCVMCMVGCFESACAVVYGGTLNRHGLFILVSIMHIVWRWLSFPISTDMKNDNSNGMPRHANSMHVIWVFEQVQIRGAVNNNKKSHIRSIFSWWNMHNIQIGIWRALEGGKWGAAPLWMYSTHVAWGHWKESTQRLNEKCRAQKWKKLCKYVFKRFAIVYEETYYGY